MIELSNEFVQKTKPVIQWKAQDGKLFERVVECLAYQILQELEQKVNNLFCNEGVSLQNCFKLLEEYFDTQAWQFFKQEAVCAQLAKDTYSWQEESIKNWVSSCKAHVSDMLKMLAESESGDCTRDTGIIIEHWQCSVKPCYTIHQINLLGNRGSHFMSVSLRAGGSPSDNGGWPGYYGSEINVSDFVRYWQKTKETQCRLEKVLG